MVVIETKLREYDIQKVLAKFNIKCPIVEELLHNWLVPLDGILVVKIMVKRNVTM